MLQRLLVGCLLVAVAGCARDARPDSDTRPSRYEHIHLLPLDQSLEEARKLLEEKGYAFEPTDPPSQDASLLISRWQAPPGGSPGSGADVRYIVSGIRVADQQSVVRIFRMSRQELSTSLADHRGPLASPRDAALEKELTLRLESSAANEPAGSTAAPEPPRQPARDPALYLYRWKWDKAPPGPDERTCQPLVRGLEEVLKPGMTILVGEQLGSQEAPRAVGNLVCEAAATGHEVALGLSIPSAEQERIDHYLASPGAPTDQDELLQGDFWRRPYQDGRSSQAVVDLIDRVRSWRAWGLPITLVAYDTALGNGNVRYAAQASRWQKRRQDRPNELFVILAGNLHVRTVQGASWDPDFKPLGWRLATSGFHLVALDLSYSRGSRRWACDVDSMGTLYCDVVSSSPSDRVIERAGLNPYIRLFDKPTEDGYHGLFYVGTLMPSYPATAEERDKPPLPRRPTSVRRN